MIKNVLHSLTWFFSALSIWRRENEINVNYKAISHLTGVNFALFQHVFMCFAHIGVWMVFQQRDTEPAQRQCSNQWPDSSLCNTGVPWAPAHEHIHGLCLPSLICGRKNTCPMSYLWRNDCASMATIISEIKDQTHTDISTSYGRSVCSTVCDCHIQLTITLTHEHMDHNKVTYHEY